MIYIINEQPFILITDDNQKQITYDRNIDMIYMSFNSESYKTRSKKKGILSY